MNKAFHPTATQIQALNAFAKAHGQFWRRELRLCLEEGKPIALIAKEHHAPLRQLRNMHGGMAYIAKHKVGR